MEWYCLPILQIDNGKHKCFSGLMLEATKDGVRRQLRRVGHFRVGQGKYGHPKFTKRYARFVDALQDPKCWAKRSVFELSEQNAGISNLREDKLYITLL